MYLDREANLVTTQRNQMAPPVVVTICSSNCKGFVDAICYATPTGAQQVPLSRVSVDEVANQR